MAPERLIIFESLPFREGIVAFGRRRVSWLPVSPGRAFPESGAPQWLSLRSGLAGHSGGTAPDLHRTSLDHRPLTGVSIHRRAVLVGGLDPASQPAFAPLDWPRPAAIV